MLFDDTAAKGVEACGLSFVGVFIVVFNFVEFLFVGVEGHLSGFVLLRQDVDVLRSHTQLPATKVIKRAGIIDDFGNVGEKRKRSFFFLSFENLDLELIEGVKYGLPQALLVHRRERLLLNGLKSHFEVFLERGIWEHADHVVPAVDVYNHLEVVWPKQLPFKQCVDRL